MWDAARLGNLAKALVQGGKYFEVKWGLMVLDWSPSSFRKPPERFSKESQLFYDVLYLV